MISGSAALTASNTVTGSLSYINTLVTGATAQGLYKVFVDNSHMNDDMADVLITTYGYNVSKRNNFMGTNHEYIISWGDITPPPPPESSGTIVFNGLDVGSGGSYVAAPNASLSTWVPGNGDFTVEWFQYQTVSGGHPRIFSIGPDTSAKYGVSIESGKVYTWPGGNNYTIGKTFVNAWVHIALVRTSGVTKCYVDGTQVGTAQNNAVNITASTFELYIGSDGITSGDGFTGNITNFRWTNAAVYSGTSFTPITEPLEVLPQTKLLLLGGSVTNPVKDSTNINTLDYENVTWSSDSPF